MMIEVSFDIGGTFTDLAFRDTESSSLSYIKVPSTPKDPSKGVMAGLHALMQKVGRDPASVNVLLHATTVAANAIIERKGSRTAFITTVGFRDTLFIARQKRYETYDIFLDKPKPLINRRDAFEVDERMDPAGQVVRPLDRASVAEVVQAIKAGEYEAVAVSLLHSYANDKHERQIRDALLSEMPDLDISLSCEVSPKYREYERGMTTVANAYVRPLMGKYLNTLVSEIEGAGFNVLPQIMQSNTGLVPTAMAAKYPIRIVESGPAAGVLLCGIVGMEEGHENVLTFDMGGTTAKLGAIDGGQPAITQMFEIDTVRYRRDSGLPLNISAIELLEIGAGGGSIASIEMGIINVGPRSAGSDPGPICYGRGATLPTVTDANLVLGLIDPTRFNAGSMTLDADAARAGIAAHIAGPLGISESEAAWGIHAIANSNMERAMRVVSEEHGRDPRNYALVAFGGAGPLHATRLAAALNVPKVIIPKGAGVGSALGLLEAEAKIDVPITRKLELNANSGPDIRRIYDELHERAEADLRLMAQDGDVQYSRYAYLRYKGQGYELKVDLPDGEIGDGFSQKLIDAFQRTYMQNYGLNDKVSPVEGIDWYLSATISSAEKGARSRDGHIDAKSGDPLVDRRQVYFPELGGYVDCPVYDRDLMRVGEPIWGPAIVQEPESSAVILPGTKAVTAKSGHLIIFMSAIAPRDN